MGWFHVHSWTIALAVRHCDCRWPALDQAERLVPLREYESAEAERIRREGGTPPPPSPLFNNHAPVSPAYCQAEVWEQCRQCDARQHRAITQRQPPPHDPWVDDGILPDVKPRQRVRHLGER